MAEPEAGEPPESGGIESAVRRIIKAVDETYLKFQRELTDIRQLITIARSDINRIERKVNDMPSQKDLDDAVQAVVDGMNTLGTDLEAAINALESQLGQGVNPASAIASLKAVRDKMNVEDALALAAAGGGPAPSPAPTPAPGGEK